LQGLKRTIPKRLPNAELRFYSDPFALLDAAKKQMPDVVVSDIRMPGLDGLEVAARLNAAKTQLDLNHPAIIMLTGTADLNAATDAINRGGVFRFYTKPCDCDVLAEGIAAALAATGPADTRAADEDDIIPRIGAAALNLLGLAVLILDKSAKIVFTNNAGGQLLAECDGLVWSPDGKCRTCLPGESEVLHALTAAAALNDCTRLGEGVMVASRRGGKRPLSLAFAPIEAAGAGHALLFVSDPENVRAPSPLVIQKLFDLTNAEARLAYRLARGAALANAAEECGITGSTARTYLKHIFAKTGTSRQAELVRLVLTSPQPPSPNGGFLEE
jgi:FixJ family two-component response regulator